MKENAAAVAAAAALLATLQQAPVFQSRVDLVALDVSVTRNGTPVAGLTPADFVVMDAGVPLQVDGVVRDDSVPLDVQLVLDTSGSLSDKRLDQLVRAARAVIRQLTSRDRIGLITFSEIVRVRSGLTNDFALVERTLSTLSGSGQSAIRDALELAVSIEPAANARTLIILFTDGVDNASWLSDEEILESARNAGRVIHVVRVPNDNEFQPALLERLTRATGGRVFAAKSDGEYERLFASALAEMRARYLVTFAPAAPPRPGWHDVTVRLRAGRADIAARPGYFQR